jgi:hypothetical protein
MLNNLIVVSIVVFSFSFAQSRAFVTFDYMNVKPASVDEYINLESEVWKPVHKAYQKHEFEVSWSLYRVRGAGTQNHYNYVTVSVYDGLGSLDRNIDDEEEIISKIYSNEDLSGFWNRTSEARLHTGRDVFFVYDQALKGNNKELSAFSSGKIGQDITVTFMQTLAGQDAVGLESKWWKPIHKERIKRKVVNSWEVLTTFRLILSLWIGFHHLDSSPTASCPARVCINVTVISWPILPELKADNSLLLPFRA